MIKHTSPISGIATFNNFVATVGYDNQIILWNSRKEPVAKATHDHLANSCSFSANGKFLLTSSSDYTARLFSIPELKLISVFSEQEDDVEMSAFHPKLELVATASRDHNVRVYNFEGKLLKTFKGHTSDVISVTWNTLGNELITTSDDGTIRVWNLDNENLNKIISQDSMETDSLVIIDSETYIAGNDNGEILYINQGNIEVIKAHTAGIKKVIYDSHTRCVITMSYDRTCTLWDLSKNNTIEKICIIQLPSIVWPRAAAFLNNQTIVFATFGSSFASYSIKDNLWDLSNIDPTDGLNAISHFQNSIYSIGDSGIGFKDNKPLTQIGSLCNFIVVGNGCLITGGQSGKVFNLTSGEEIFQHHSPLNCGSSFIYNKNNYFLVGTYTGEILLFKEDMKQINFIKKLKIFKNAVKSLTTNPSGVFTVCATGEVNCILVNDLFNKTSDLSIKSQHGHEKIANTCCTINDNLFASSGRDLRLRFWSIQNKILAQKDNLSTPFKHSIKTMCSFENNRYIALGSYDGCIAIYEVISKKWSQIKKISQAGISNLCSYENYFLASSYNGKTYTLSIKDFNYDYSN